MPASDWQLNRFERILFRSAVGLAAVIIAIRVGAIAAVWLMRH